LTYGLIPNKQKMELQLYKNYEEISWAAAYLILQQVQRKADSLICFPSGESPTGMFKQLVKFAQEGSIDFSQTNFVGLDEWVGMDKTDENSCTYFLNKHFFEPLNIPASQIHFFNAAADDLDAECEKMNKHISQLGGLDLIVVGIGLNGHIGLNEPGTNFKTYAHHSPLDPITATVAQKYFKQETVVTEGITLGLQHLAEAKTPVLIASGTKKADIMAKALNGPVTADVPASIMQTLQNAQIFLDHDAAEKLLTHQS